MSKMGLAQHDTAKYAIKTLNNIRIIFSNPTVTAPIVTAPTAISTNWQDIIDLRKPLNQGFRHIEANVRQSSLDKYKIENFMNIIEKIIACTSAVAPCVRNQRLYCSLK